MKIEESKEYFWKKHFDKSAINFEKDFKSSSYTEHSFNRQRATFFRVFRNENISKEKKILDLGCGPGTFSILLNGRGYKLTGVDYSTSMIAKAIKKSKGKDINYEVASIYSLPFKDNSFDVIICIGVFQYLTSEKDAIKEIKRILKGNGILILITLNSLSLRIFYKKILNKLRGIFSSKKVKNNDELVERRYNPFNLKKMFEARGFNKVDIHGIYIFPKLLSPIESLFENAKLFQLMDNLPFASMFVATGFLLKASIKK